jgi:hypothetical protein
MGKLLTGACGLSQKFATYSIVIPGKLAKASATRNPGISKADNFLFSERFEAFEPRFILNYIVSLLYSCGKRSGSKLTSASTS